MQNSFLLAGNISEPSADYALSLFNFILVILHSVSDFGGVSSFGKFLSLEQLILQYFAKKFSEFHETRHLISVSHELV